jgi:hypothetical protein
VPATRAQESLHVPVRNAAGNELDAARRWPGVPKSRVLSLHKNVPK